jgi:TolA-binding protein
MRRHHVVLIAVLAFGMGSLLTAGMWSGETQPDSPGASARRESSAPFQALQRQLNRLEQTLTLVANSGQRITSQGLSLAEAQATTPIDEAELRQTISRVVREELQKGLAAVGALSPETDAAALAAAELLNSPENQRAYRAARDVVQVALADGNWTDDDVQDLRSAFAHLTTDQQQEVLQILIPAVNNGQLMMETTGPPL